MVDLGHTGEQDPEVESSGGRKRPLRGRVVLLALTAICLYFFAPSIGEVFAAWGRLGDVHTAWMVPAVVCAIASYGCVWVVQAIAIGTRNWFAVITTQLAGNAFNRITPGGGATGMVMQTNMLTAAGIDAPRAATALTVQSVLSTAALVAMPVFSIPFIIAGTQIPSRLLSAVWIGIPVFLVTMAIGVAVFVFDAPLLWLSRVDRAHQLRVPAGVGARRRARRAPAEEPRRDPSTRSARGGGSRSARRCCAGSSSTA